MFRKVHSEKKRRKESKQQEDNVTRPSDDGERQPRIWTIERNGTVQRRLESLEYRTYQTAEQPTKKKKKMKKRG